MRILHDVLYLQKLNLRWVPLSVGEAPIAERVSLSIDLLGVLQENQKTGFAQVITSDEPSFYFGYLHQSILVPSRDEVPEKNQTKN
jgi:hypothetical protein